jgi:peptidoglycan/LPS O-acetylase OafA/YrhL
MKASSEEYRPDIDGLRALAVIAVVAYHAFPEHVPGGFVGVDVFFVISGFLISGIIFRKLDSNSFSYSDFYQRRIRRIFPALMIVLFAVLAFGWLTLLPDEYTLLGKHTAAGALFSSNIELWKEAGYFDSQSEHKPLLHLWSLGVEEQFYLVWPTCLVVFWKFWKRRQITIAAVASLALVSFLFNVFRVNAHPVSTFYLPFSRLWELLLGCLLAYITIFQDDLFSRLSRQRTISASTGERVKNALAITGLALIAIALWGLNKDRLFPGWWALLPTFGSVLLIYAGPDTGVSRLILRNPVIVLIGLISYPLYLWHWPLLSFARILGVSNDAVNVALILVSFTLAWATWRYVEVKLRRRPSLSMAVTLGGGIAASFVLGSVIFFLHGIPGRLPGKAHDFLVDVSGPEPHYVSGPFQSDELSLNVQSKQGPADAAVIGDSHAQSLFFGLADVDPRRTWLAIGNNSCPPTLGITAGTDAAECKEKMARVFDYVTGPHGPKVVVLAFYGYYAETTDYAADHLLNKKGPSHIPLVADRARGLSKEDVLLYGLRNSIALLLKNGKQVYLMIDVPELPFLPTDCGLRPLPIKHPTCDLQRTVVDNRQQGLRKIVSNLRQTFPSLHIFDPLPLLCHAAQCTVVSQDFSYYRDSHHLSLRGSELVGRALVDLINQTSQVKSSSTA